MTIKETIEGLKKCVKAVDITDCHDCPFRSDGWFGVGCRQELMQTALDLLKIYTGADVEGSVKHDA